MTTTYYPPTNVRQINLVQTLLLSWWEEEIGAKGRRDFFWRKWILDPKITTVKLEDFSFPRDFGIFCTETVLRKTRAETVEIHFRPFFGRFHSFQEVIDADTKELRNVLYPLGRVSQNVRDLKQRATIIVNEFNSEVPHTKESIRRLMKTAKRKRHIYFVEAIALYIHELFSAPVDVNVERIYCRVFGIIRKNYGVQDDQEFCEFAAKLVPKNNYIIYNLALLDLGALICIPKDPKCSLCPLNTICAFKKRINN